MSTEHADIGFLRYVPHRFCQRKRSVQTCARYSCDRHTQSHDECVFCVVNVNVARTEIVCHSCVYISTAQCYNECLSEVLSRCRSNNFASRKYIDESYADEESTQLHPFALSSSPLVVATAVAPSSLTLGACQCCGCHELSPTFPHSTGFQVATCDMHGNK